jgi:hypothetical protein
MSKLVVKKTRQISAVTLFGAALLVLSFFFTNTSRSANPTGGTLNPGGSAINWTGTATGGASPEGETTCVEGATCDTFTLTLSGTPANWVGQKAQVVISWPNSADDYDVYIHKGAATGPVVGSSAAGGGGPETVPLDPNNPSIGTGTFFVRVVYWLVPAPGQYTGTASVVAGPTPTPSPSPGATPAPTPVIPNTPRFVNHYAPPGIMEDAAEPTMGVNWNTENKPRGVATAFQNKLRTGTIFSMPNGGTSLYYGGVNDYFLRATFDDCASPAVVQWDQIDLTIANAPRAGYDPILYTDHWTGRTFVCQEFALTPAGSSMEFTDDDGENMFISQGGGPSGVDHQTVGGGPLRADPQTGATPANVVTPKIPANAGPGATPIPNPGATPYPHGVYYASQSIATATSQRSVDGGFTFPQQIPMFTASDCAGLHGHIKIAEDGTAYVPDKACEEAGVPFVFGGKPSVVVSEDNGATWDVRPVPNADSSAGVDDPSVGVSWCPPGVQCDKVERSKHIYLGFMYTDGRPGVAYSNNKGQSWVRTVDLTQFTDVKHIAFPAMAVGDPDRAAFAFLGTTTEGNYSAPEFPGVWHLYIATTFDFGQTWTVQNVSPEGPIQRGGVCGDGTCRNLLDFMDIQIDKQGRVLVAGQDGCIGGCEIGGANSFTAKAFISRQSGGRRMFSVNDAQTAEPRLAGAPDLTGNLETPTRVSLTWKQPDNGGSPITAYNVYRSPIANPDWSSLTPIATVTEPRYVDANAPAGDKFYIVTAVTAMGESPYCKVFAPVAVALPNPCALPGVLVNNDIAADGSDSDAPQQVPVDPRVNVRQLFVAEPFIGGNAEPLTFTMQVAPSTQNTAPPNSQWIIIWNRQGNDPSDAEDSQFDRMYAAMVTDSAGTPSFEYGKFGVPIDTSGNGVPSTRSNTPKKIGNADSGSYDPLTGVIRITIGKQKYRAIDGGSGKYQAGNDLAGTNVRTYFNRVDYPSQRSQNNASDITADATYTLVGSAACAPVPELVRAFSRKTHGNAGVYDVRLAPLGQPTDVAIEPRRGSGAQLNEHQIVFVFGAPVTFTGATATSQNGGAAAVQSTAVNGNEVIVTIAAANAQTVNVALQGVSAGGNGASISVPVALLMGDVNSSRRVDGNDVSQVQAQTRQPLENANFRMDVNTSGLVDGNDVSLVQGRTRTRLP